MASNDSRGDHSQGDKSETSKDLLELKNLRV
jgi:hypothetical protein